MFKNYKNHKIHCKISFSFSSCFSFQSLLHIKQNATSGIGKNLFSMKVLLKIKLSPYIECLNYLDFDTCFHNLRAIENRFWNTVMKGKIIYF